MVTVLNLKILAQNQLEIIRERFHQANEKDDIISIINMNTDDSADINSNTIQAYKAVCLTRMAQYTISPFAKFKYFYTGTELLESSIRNNAILENVYLRLLVQLSVPRFLNYHGNIEEDLEVFIEDLALTELSESDKKLFISTLLKTKNKDYDLKSLEKININ